MVIWILFDWFAEVERCHQRVTRMGWWIDHGAAACFASPQEGYRALWLGTRQSLMMSVPMVGIYMPLYDQLKASWASSLGAAAPLAAGALSRTIAVVCVAPFELLRTRLQVRCALAIRSAAI